MINFKHRIVFSIHSGVLFSQSAQPSALIPNGMMFARPPPGNKIVI